jgi:hypothetical protein
MPQAPANSDIAFTVPVRVDSLHPDGFRTVHLVVTKPRRGAATNMHFTAGQLLFVFFMGALVILAFLKITGNKKFKRVLDAAEKLAAKKW